MLKFQFSPGFRLDVARKQTVSNSADEHQQQFIPSGARSKGSPGKNETITMCNTYRKYKINFFCSINKFLFPLFLQKYVDSIIKGAIEKVKEEKSSKPFKVSLYTQIKFLSSIFFKLLTQSLRLRLSRAGNQIVAIWISKYFIL